MIYFIAFILKGNAKKYQETLIKDVAYTFDIRKPYFSRIPPHITLKAPFQCENIKIVEKILKDYSLKCEKFKVVLDGIGTFRNNVIFIDVKKDKSIIQVYNGLYKELKKVKFLEFLENEGKNMHFHATIATGFDVKSKFNNILEYISKNYDTPYFKLDFDNISILKHMNRKWEIYKVYKIGAKSL